MKIKNLLQAPLILEELKRLNIDVNALDPQTKIKIKDGVVLFEPEKDSFVSKPQEKMQYSEEPEYYYLKETDRIEEGDECSKKPIYNNDEIVWHKVKYHIGRHAGDYKEFIVRREVQKPEYYYLKEGDIIEEGDEVEDSRFASGWAISAYKGEEVTRNCLKYRRKIQKNPTS